MTVRRLHYQNTGHVVTCRLQFSLELYRSRMTIIFVWISSAAELYYYVTARNICVLVRCT